MAWSHLYGTASTALELMTAIKNFMVSIGWTIADDYLTAANPFIALKSTGESGNSSHGILLERNDSGTSITTTVFRTWETIGDTLWTPGSGNTVSGQSTLTKSTNAPSFLDYFAIGDFVCLFNNGTYGLNTKRSKVTNVTASALTLSASYPYPASTISSTSNLMITKGGPFIHARGVSSYNGGWITSAASAHQYFIYGDLDTIIVVTRVGIYYYCAYIGRYTTAYPEIISKSLSTVTEGSSTSVNVTDGSLFTVGYKYQIGNDKHMHSLTVTSIEGNTVNFSGGLTGGATGIVYDIGSDIGQCLNPICSAGFNNANSTGATATVPGSPIVPYANDVSGQLTGGYVQGYTREVIDIYNPSFAVCLSPEAKSGVYSFLPRSITSSNAKELFGYFRNLHYMYTQIGNNEDFIRLDNSSGPTYKLFNLGGGSYPWCVVKE